MVRRRRQQRTEAHQWVSSVEMSGLLVSEPILQSHFPDGPPALDSWKVKRFRNEFERFYYLKGPDQQKALGRWVDFIFSDILEIPNAAWNKAGDLPAEAIVDLPELAQTLKPSRVLQDDGEIRLQCLVVSADQALDRADRTEGRWKVSPATKLNYILRETNTRLGLLTNGSYWRLMYAESEHSTVHITWAIQTWNEERATLNAFAMLLNCARLFEESGEVQLLDLIKDSQERQAEVADQLGVQVREATHTFIRALNTLDKKHDGQILEGMTLADIYELSIVVMMRLVFMLYAEENGLLPHGEVIYDEAYGVNHLAYTLQQIAFSADELLDYQTDAWQSLLATFRLLHGGCQHPDLNLKAYGGSLFDPKRFKRTNQPEEENSLLEDHRVRFSNRTIHEIFHKLTYASTKVGRSLVNQRVSYNTIDVEQIGYVYEGLLDHETHRAQDVAVRLLGGTLAIIEMNELEQHQGTGFVKWLKKITDRSDSAIKRALETEPDLDACSKLKTLVEHHEDLFERLLPFIHLIDLNYLAKPGDLYLGLGPTRRQTASHYTPQILTEPIVRKTLEPLCYENPDERTGLKTPDKLLDLKVADIAMGSGAFLVQAVRYLSERLVESWDILEKDNPEVPITPYGEPSKGHEDEEILPIEREERLFLAHRIVTDRCIYGVDKNPLAVEMAKLSLWLVTLAKDRPFTFLNHALKEGDSLIGVNLDQLQTWSLSRDGKTIDLIAQYVQQDLDRSIKLRREIRRLIVVDVETQEYKIIIHQEAEEVLAWLKLAGDLIVSPALTDREESTLTTLNRSAFEKYRTNGVDKAFLLSLAQKQLGEVQPLHWPLVFPEVFQRENPGFDAIIGNPPFKGGQHLTGTFGKPYREYLVENLSKGKRGSADLIAYFFLRAYDLLAPDGCLGLLATNTIAQGATREAGLDQIKEAGGDIYNAIPTMAWPGIAAVHVAKVHIKKGEFQGQKELDTKKVGYISTHLDDSQLEGKPYQLIENQNKSYQGCIVLGMGFVLEPEEAKMLIAKEATSRDVLYPYLIGEDLNSRPDQSPSRWVINFHDWPLSRSAKGSWDSGTMEQKRHWLQEGRVPKDYPNPVAADYPECLSIIEEKVLPERLDQNDEGAKKYWWRFLRPRPELYASISGMDRVLVRSRVAELHAIAMVGTDLVLSDRLAVFTYSSFNVFTLLHSTIHELWARRYSSTLKGDMMYNPTDCFETFPFPTDLDNLGTIGEEYYNIRKDYMSRHDEGLTDFYRNFHTKTSSSPTIKKLRQLHADMDWAVAKACCWDDLRMEHDFRIAKTFLDKNGRRHEEIRWTVSDQVRREILKRLLELNHQRYAEEVEAGLHEESKRVVRANTKRSQKSNTNQNHLFDGSE